MTASYPRRSWFLDTDFPDLPEAACHAVDVDPEWFHPVQDYVLPSIAAAICGSCPAKAPCLEFALTHHETGIWAGTTEAQRNGSHRRQLRAKTGAM